jgi:hypothetical protein
MTLADTGTLDDPFVVCCHHFLEVGVGEEAGGDEGAYG